MDTVPLVRKPPIPVLAKPKNTIWVIHKLTNWWNKRIMEPSSSSSMTKIEPVRPKNKQKRIVRTLARWWKKRRAYYIHVKNGSEGSNSSNGMAAQMHDATMDELDSMSSDERSKLIRDNIDGRFHSSSSEYEPDTFDYSSFTTPEKSNRSPVNESVQLRGVVLRQVPSPAPTLQPNLEQRLESPPKKESAMNQTDFQIPFVHQRSDQCSIMSIDSLLDSEWDPEDDIFVDDADDDSSQITPVATNAITSYEFLSEHMNFLHVQTQPRQVHVFFSYLPGTSEMQLGNLPSQNTKTIGAERRR